MKFFLKTYFKSFFKIQFKSTSDLSTSVKGETLIDSQCGWQGTERDYKYEELLDRVFKIMREKNPDIVIGEKKKFVMKPPHVARVGTKKTSFTNFGEICRLLVILTSLYVCFN